MVRPQGQTYIDQSGPASATATEPSNNDQFEDAQSSGSSTEEESEGEPFQDDDGLPEEDQIELVEDGEDFEHGDDYDEDWDVDDEDWELANGDFTKQYNRVRQQHAAGSGTAPLPARNAPQQPAKKGSNTASTSNTGTPTTAKQATTKPNIMSSVGVAMNPKVSQVRQEKDKSDRATQDQVLDGRTRLVLAGLVNRNVIGKIERCVSTGKEANVYFASPGVAVKVYRTSILNFRSRANYIVGEQRFRGEYTSSKNPRKMIRVWAEKELRNLRRLAQGGVRAPQVHECKENVLVMEFLGRGDDASPRLKDAEIEGSDMVSALYTELLIAVRRMYQHCHLVHADLSEYNILLHEGHLWIIDVSQSVEHDHPKAFDFLRADLSNVEDFFGRRGVKCLGLRRAWEFTVTENIGLSKEVELGPDGDNQLAAILSEWAKAPSNKTDDAVFLSSYIPRTLAEVYDPERDVDLLNKGGGDDLIYAGVTGLKLADSTAASKSEASTAVAAVTAVGMQEAQGGGGVITIAEGDNVKDGDDGEGEGEGSDAGSDDENDDKKPRGFRHEDKDSKKERKKAVKDENREKRKHKMPKAEKARLMKKSQGK